MRVSVSEAAGDGGQTESPGHRVDSAAAQVSLVIIAHNEVARAPSCIRSILAQQATAPLEVILVDDGSTDGTAEAVEAAAAGDARLRIVRLPENRGRGAARSAGVEAARGDAIAFVDADVTLPPDWLARCLAELPGYAAVGGVAIPDGHTAVVARLSGATPREVGGSMPITAANVLFDATVLREAGFDPRDRLGEDFRLVAKLRRGGHSLRRVPGLIVRHEESKSYAQALRWRFENGVDAATHPRELGRIRFADIVWIGWMGAWIAGLAGSLTRSPWWLLLGPSAGAAAGLAHAASRFEPRPARRFALACVLDAPMLTAYLVGRTIGAPRLLRARR